MVHVKPKRPLNPIPHLQDTINLILKSDDEPSLTRVLDHFDAPHRFERPDERNLIHWYKLLNRFDQILERYVRDRDILAKSSKPASENINASDRTQPPIISRSASHQQENLSHLNHAADEILVTSPSRSVPGLRVPIPPDLASSSAPDKSSTSQSTPPSTKLSFSPSSVLIRLVLRVTQRLIRNASHDTRYIYNSVEHLCALLADENSAIVLLTLEILNMLLQRSPKLRAARIPPTPELTERLLELSMGWGGRENGLGLLDCCSSSADDLVSTDGSRLVFKYIKGSSSSRSENGEDSSIDRERLAAHSDMTGRRSFLPPTIALRLASCGPFPLSPSASNSFVPREELPTVTTVGRMTTIRIEDVGSFKGDEKWLLTEFANRHHVPRSRLFSLLSAFRRAKRFSTGRDGRIAATIIRLYAVTTLFSIQPHPLSLHDLLTKEPEFLRDVVALARAEAKNHIEDIPRSLRIIAIRCLTAMSCDRQTHSAVMNVTEVSLHHGALTTLLRTEIASLLSPCADMADSDADGAGSDGMKCDTDATRRVEERTPGKSFDLLSECNRVSPSVQRIHTTESLLGLVYSLAVASRSDGATPLANSGVLAILIPLLNDRDIRHSRVVAKAIRAMQGIIEGSSQSIGRQLFRDQDGLSLVAERIAVEVGIEVADIPDADQRQTDDEVESEALRKRGESHALYERLGQRQMTPREALEHQPPSASATSRGQLPQSKWALLRSLLQLLLVALGSGGNEVRALVVESMLPRALRKIMAQPFTHGGGLFQSAATVTADIAHAEPTATPDLVKAGIATTVLRSVEQGLPPCGEAVRCIPNLLAALCLAPAARDIIVTSRPLKKYLLRLSTPFYTRALHGDTPIYIGSTLDELMRHVEALRPDGNEAMVDYLKMSAKFVNTETRGFARPETSELDNKSEDMDDERAAAAKRLKSPFSGESGDHEHPEGDGERVSSDEALLDKMKLAIANNSCRLAGFAQGSSEHQEGIVEGGGLDEMIELRNAPALACPEASVRDGYVFSRHYPNPSMTVVSLATSLRNLSTRHGTAVLQSLFRVIMNDAALVLKVAKDLDDVWLPEEEKDFQLTNASSDLDGRKKARVALSHAVRKLRVDVVLLSGLSRGGPGSSAGAWENAGGSHVASVIATVERAARFHLAKVYTGLTLSASSDGDLNTARVTATGNPTMKSVPHLRAGELLADLNKAIGFPLTKSKAFEEACKQYEVPPEASESMRQNVKGLAWHLVTFAVATQRLYSTLARGLTFNSRRPSRDPARYAASARCLAATMGRIFALHLKAAAPLWEMKVITMGRNRVVAAWDFVRGVLIEIKGALFDENRRVTQSLFLKYFLEAGGAEALSQAMRPAHLVRAASLTCPDSHADMEDPVSTASLHQKFETILHDNAITLASSLLAASDAVSHLKLTRRLEVGKNSGTFGDKDNDQTMSSDSISNQVRGISRIAVSDTMPGEDHMFSSGEEFRRVLADKNYISSLRKQAHMLSKALLEYSLDISVRRVALDVWNTCCSFLQLLGSCPGLGTAHGSTPDPPRLTSLGHEWTSEDVQRSSLSVSVELMTAVTEQPQQLIAAFRPESPAMMDILGVIHSTSQVFAELDKKPPSEQQTERDGDVQDEEPQQEQPPIDPPPVDAEMVQSLSEMGFPEQRVRRALRRTDSRSIETAMDWLLSHPEEDEDSAESDDGAEDSQGDDGNDEEGEGEEEELENVTTEGDEADDPAVEDAGPASDIDGESESEEGSEDHAPSSTAADDQVMIDTEPQTNEQATANDTEEQLAASASRTALKEDTDGCKAPNKSVPLMDIVSLESEGKQLLDQSVVMELNALASALQLACTVSGEEVSQLKNMAAERMSANIATMNEESGRSKATKPVSVSFFKERKARFFTSLLALTRAVVEGSGTHVYGVHLPYIAVELLSILQKDGSLLEEDSSSFASLLTEGLNVALSNMSDDSDRPVDHHSKSSPVALWAHYGGFRSRKALRESGAFRLAYESLHRSMDEWDHSVSTSRLLDSEASHPIKKLSINERQWGIEKRDSQGTTSHSHGRQAPSVSLSLRSPTKAEASLLKRMTTCILLLDAGVRYHAKDQLIERAEHIPTGENEKIEVDEQMREIFGAGAISMDIDAKPRSEKDRKASEESKSIEKISEADVKAAKAAAMTKRKESIKLAKKEVTSMSHGEGLNKSLEIAKHNEALVACCIRILQMWKDVEVGDAILSVLQLLGSLTKDWALASISHKAGVIELLLSMPHLDKRSVVTTDVNTVRFLTKTVLRHITEDPETLKEAMEAEIRALTKSRPSATTKSLIGATAPMVARDLQAFLSAAANSVKASESVRGSEVQTSPSIASKIDMAELVENRPNVKDVVLGLSHLLVKREGRKGASYKPLVSSRMPCRGLPLFALESIAEIAEVSHAAAVAFVRTPSPSVEASGSALDYIIQVILPQTKIGGPSRALSLDSTTVSDREEPGNSVRKLFLALCSVSGNVHEQAVAALARATKLEATKEKVSPGLICGIAHCIAPGVRLKVLRAILHSTLANDLARSLEKLDMSLEANSEVASSVLRALALVGQAASHVARHSDNSGDDVMLGLNGGDPWISLRDREEVMRNSASYMVL